MYDIQTTSSTGNVHNSGSNPVVVDVAVAAGRVPVSAGFQATSPVNYGGGRGNITESYKLNATTWRFVFGNNTSGSSVTYSCHVYHVPEFEEVSVLRVAP